MPKNHTDIATRALVVTLKSSGGKTSSEVHELTGISIRTINSIYGRAITNGFDPNQRPIVIRDSFLTDLPRSGRPSKHTARDKILTRVRRDRYGRERTCADIAMDLSLTGTPISAMTVWRILRRSGLRKTKPTRKPGLTLKMRKDRLQWCLERKDWTLEDWKNVIWSDETSVVLLHRRGGYRVWRTPQERLVRSCIRERWKGSSEFMFWGCFSYERKGPCHCWLPETAAEKSAAEKALTKLNQDLEPYMKEQWEMETQMRRLNLRQQSRGRKPTWKWNQKNGKVTRRKGTGIDWYRYQQKVLIPKLLPFAQECLLLRPHTVVQEDRAPSHAHHLQQQVYDQAGVQRLLWCGNSPDLNAIEPCWPWMKRETTRKGAPSARKEAIQKWEECWDDLPLEAIQRWIERIPRHVQEIIKLEGGNEYQEGRGV